MNPMFHINHLNGNPKYENNYGKYFDKWKQQREKFTVFAKLF